MSSRGHVGALSRRYAKAFLDLLQEEKNAHLEEARAALSLLRDVFKEHALFFQTLCNGTLPLAERKAVLKSVLEKLSIAGHTRQFLLLLMEKDRLRIFSDIVRKFDDLADERAGILRAHIMTASPLSAAVQKRLIAEIERLTSKKVFIEVEQKPELIGGLIAKIGHTLVDASLQNQLAQLKKHVLSEPI